MPPYCEARTKLPYALELKICKEAKQRQVGKVSPRNDFVIWGGRIETLCECSTALSMLSSNPAYRHGAKVACKTRIELKRLRINLKIIIYMYICIHV